MEKVAKILILACLFLSCEKEYEEPKHCIQMEISNSIPVQFWVNGQETFNEKVVCGITPVCWCQPFQCDDEITIQVKNAGLSLRLIIELTDGSLVDIIPFVEVSNGVVGLTFTPDDLGVCDSALTFKISSGADFAVIEDSEDTDGWENSGTGEDWLVGDYVLKSSVYTSPVLSVPIVNGEDIDINANVYAGNTGNHLYVILAQSSGSDEQIIDFGASLVIGDNIQSVTADNDYDLVKLYCETENSINRLELNLITIQGDLQSVPLVNQTFSGSISGWSNDFTGIDWFFEPTDYSRVVLTSGQTSKTFSQTLPTPINPGMRVKITVNAKGEIGGDGKIAISIRDSLGSQQALYFDDIVFDGAFHNIIGDAVIVTPGPLDIIGVNVGSTTLGADVYIDAIYVEVSTAHTVDGYFPGWINDMEGYPWDTESTRAGVVLPLDEQFSVDLFKNNTISKTVKQDFSPYTGQSIFNFSAQISVTDLGTPGSIVVNGTVLTKNDGVIVGSKTFALPVGFTTEVFEIFNPGVEFDEIGMVFENTGTSDYIHIVIYSASFGSGDLRASSDCISIKENHPCTILVNYSNATAFDGVPDSSPMQSFNLRIPAVFFEEQNTQEQEDIELSNDEIVRLYNKVEEKRLLKIGFMPHYMHRKLLLALVHDFVTIDGKEWIKRDEYKKNEGNRHYPLKSAEVLLTDKNFIKENQL